MNGWIGVDLDGTLARYDGWKGCEHIGEPIALMVERVKLWLSEGKEVRIVTARVYAPADDWRRQEEAATSILAIQKWCTEHIGQRLAISCTKDFAMIELWDDRCVQVELNTGERVASVDFDWKALQALRKASP